MLVLHTIVEILPVRCVILRLLRLLVDVLYALFLYPSTFDFVEAGHEFREADLVIVVGVELFHEHYESYEKNLYILSTSSSSGSKP